MCKGLQLSPLNLPEHRRPAAYRQFGFDARTLRLARESEALYETRKSERMLEQARALLLSASE